MPRPKLKIVGNELSAKDELRELFAEQDELDRMTRDCLQRQRDARKRYADEEGLLAMPSMDTLRKVCAR